jgi:CRP-like cAMP-binding protein
MADIKQTLAEHPFLKNIKPEYLPYLAEGASEVDFEAGQYLLRETEQADEFYLLLKGKVALGTFIFGRGFTTIQTIGEGEIVGWSWLIPPYRWRFNALSILPTKAIALDGRRLREKCEADPEFGYELLKSVAQVIGERLTATRLRLEL